MPNHRPTPPEHRPSLSVVIPAYNEEDSVGAVIERTLLARPQVLDQARLSGMDVIVVDDGSTDRTGEIVRRCPQVELVSLEQNRGYGAAIKAGFARATGDLLGFLDADGSCDPAFFGALCAGLEEAGADIAVGARLGRGTEMPWLRRVGNRVFARIIRLFGGAGITDSASGMRVVRRSALPRLYPLPDGMHFTPAMSSLAIFDPEIEIVEVPIPYARRAGRSKLRVVGDGLRFLRTIVETALTYRPLRLLGAGGAVALVLGAGYAIAPVRYFLQEGRLEEDMIYRLVAVVVAFAAGVNLVAVGLIGQQAVGLIREDWRPAVGWRRALNRLLLRYFVPWGGLAVVVGVALNWPSLVEYARYRQVSAHWIYVLTGGLLVTVGLELIAFGVLARVMNILAARKAFGRQ